MRSQRFLRFRPRAWHGARASAHGRALKSSCEGAPMAPARRAGVFARIAAGIVPVAGDHENFLSMIKLNKWLCGITHLRGSSKKTGITLHFSWSAGLVWPSATSVYDICSGSPEAPFRKE